MEYTTTITEQKPIVITIGNFDGLHKGHQRLMHELQSMAQALECTPAVVIFSPHVLAVIRPEMFVQYLTTVEEKLALIQQFGFPTANLQLDPHKLLPADGVYAVYARIQNLPGSDANTSVPVYKGVTNIGIRPTFNGKERLVEAHLLDVDLDLYEKYLELDFIARLRGEQRFPHIEALKAQITADVEQARQILATGG